ncbi:hypothetical protein [Actinacidiphila sp. ITFR-21]|uniref:hypothetical protein n=1 Tax=Actinacidiphila sp. ITFR-21 TaxID=3075199 RepID=UPI002889DA95|nr:hypothetical protein [Streptomyces sp. ITFR-21]WNI18957.1 hypothetical protein RLT57_27775 [Streptomyces sp. ITFR-21]
MSDTGPARKTPGETALLETPAPDPALHAAPDSAPDPAVSIASATGLSVTAVGVAVQEQPDYRPVAGLAADDDLLPLVRAVADLNDIPLDRLEMLTDSGDTKNVSAMALAALGRPDRPQPLYYVRSGPLPDPYVATLARLVHEADWAGEDTGITHLDELGGTAVFDLLDWAVGEGPGATALVCDEVLFADSRLGPVPAAAVALRVRRGPGPLEVLAVGEGTPGAWPRNAADHRFTGRRACDGWIALGRALADGRIADGDRLLLHTRGEHREGWLLLRAADTAGLELADAHNGPRSAGA